jgi:pSer/pThr/pTyr-binding forkhead associated (FHA) protein
MTDPRLNSGHFEVFGRRQDYRQARQALFDARGWLTLAAEYVQDRMADSDDWPALLPVRPDQVLPGTKYVLVDQQAGRSHSLQTGLNTIGRLPDNDIVLDDRVISRRHCVLLVHAWGGCELHDTASLNGTFVNGRRIHQPARLSSGDRIQVGQRLLLFLREEDCSVDSSGGIHPETAVLS